MDIVFEATFVATGDPTIEIYEVSDGNTYTLVKTDTMTATPLSGLYSYWFKDGNAVKNYTVRMTLGAEKLESTYNSIFSSILARAGGGGGGSVIYSKMTELQVRKIVDMAKKLFQDGLDDISIEIPTDLGRKEVTEAISAINSASQSTIAKLEKKVGLATDKQIQKIALDYTKDHSELIGAVEYFLKGCSNENVALAEGIKEHISNKAQDATETASEGQAEIIESIEAVEGVARKGVDHAVLMERLLAALKEESYARAQGVTAALKAIIKETRK